MGSRRQEHGHTVTLTLGYEACTQVEEFEFSLIRIHILCNRDFCIFQKIHLKKKKLNYKQFG